MRVIHPIRMFANGLVLIASSGLAFTSLAAQSQPAAAPPVVFKSQTLLVQVPVIVRSGDAPVLGLKKDDFHLTEDGRDVTIANVEEVVGTNKPLTLPVRPPGSSASTQVKNLVFDPSEPRVATLLLLDTLNTPFLDQAYGRKELVKYLATHPSGGPVVGLAILSSKGIHVVQGLTSDPAALLAAMKRVSGKISTLEGTDVDTVANAVAQGPGGDLYLGNALVADPASAPDSAIEGFIEHADAQVARFQLDQALETTLRSFLQLAWGLQGVPGRKSVIWATGSFPFRTTSENVLPGGRLGDLYEKTMQALTDAQVAVYPVDVRGLVVTSPDASTAGVRGGGRYARQIGLRNNALQSSLDTLREFAEMTGGRAFFNTNDIAGSTAKAVADGSNYYILTYYLDSSKLKPGYRKLKVKLNRDHVEVRARSGFFVTKSTGDLNASKRLELDYASISPFDATGLSLGMDWAIGPSSAPSSAQTAGAKKQVILNVKIAGRLLTVEAADGNHLNLDVAVFAQDKKANVAGTTGKTLDAHLQPASLAKLRDAGLKYSGELELAPGEYSVRVIVRDNLSGKLGSVTTLVTVP